MTDLQLHLPTERINGIVALITLGSINIQGNFNKALLLSKRVESGKLKQKKERDRTEMS